MDPIYLGGFSEPLAWSKLLNSEKRRVAETIVASLIMGTTYGSNIKANPKDRPPEARRSEWGTTDHRRQVTDMWSALQAAPRPRHSAESLRTPAFLAVRARDRVLLQLTARHLDASLKKLFFSRSPPDQENIADDPDRRSESRQTGRRIENALRTVNRFLTLGGAKELTRAKSWESVNYRSVKSVWQRWRAMAYVACYLAAAPQPKHKNTQEKTINSAIKLTVKRKGWKLHNLGTTTIYNTSKSQYCVSHIIAAIFLTYARFDQNSETLDSLYFLDNAPTLEEFRDFIVDNMIEIASRSIYIESLFPEYIGSARYELYGGERRIRVMLPPFLDPLPDLNVLPRLTDDEILFLET